MSQVTSPQRARTRMHARWPSERVLCQKSCGTESDDRVMRAQMAKDVTLFLCWTAEPEHDERKKAGIKIMAGLTLAAIAAGWYKRFLWSPLKSRKISFH